MCAIFNKNSVSIDSDVYRRLNIGMLLKHQERFVGMHNNCYFLRAVYRFFIHNTQCANMVAMSKGCYVSSNSNIVYLTC